MSQVYTAKRIADDFVLFEAETFSTPTQIRARHNNKSKSDPHFPPDKVLWHGDQAVRDYWNNKNLRKRVKN